VKTSLNFGGKAERSLPPAELARLGMHLAQHVTARHRALHLERS